MLRALIYVRLPSGAFDERGFRMLKTIRELRKANERLSLPQFKEMLREQYLLVLLDEERAIDALPKLLGARRAGQRGGARPRSLVSSARRRAGRCRRAAPSGEDRGDCSARSFRRPAGRRAANA